ncbi:hypothetical protein Aperf_G00000067635 [Anoplocephala perfoliata]
MRAHDKHCASPDDDGEDDDMSSCADHNGLDRKRRRGIIEKRRRDRINYNLSELRRLVPDAAQKQTSTKLEKAEILQMTVEFLQRIHKDGTILNTEMRLLENRLLGFQECFAEVTRFLSALPVVTSVDEVFRKKLLSHLHACIYRRDYEARTRLASLSTMTSGGGSSSSGNNVSHDTPGITSWQPTSDLQTGNPSAAINANSSHESHQVSNPQAYWPSRPVGVPHKAEENQWIQPDYTQKNPLKAQPTSGVNESQSTTSPSLLGTLEETDSGNSTVNRFSPGERDISTGMQSLLHSTHHQTYVYEPSYHSGGGYEEYAFGYQQSYTSEPPMGVGSVSHEPMALRGYQMDDHQNVSNPHKEMPYYTDNF